MPGLSFRRPSSNSSTKEKSSFFGSFQGMMPAISRRFSRERIVDESVGKEVKSRRSKDSIKDQLQNATDSVCGNLPDLHIGELNTCPSEMGTRVQTPPRRFPRCASAIYDLIPGKLCVAFHPNHDFSRAEIKRRPDLFFFSTDLHERYTPFCKDFGPVSVGVMYHFWQYVRSKELHPLLRGRPLVYYTDVLPKNQANAAVLLGAYMMLEHNMTANDAAKAFERLPQYPFLPFQDISMTTSFVITVRDCLLGLEKAMQVGWFDKDNFDLQAFLDLENPAHGDISVIGRFVAFRGPNTIGDGEWQMPPSTYLAPFDALDVGCIVRLNEPGCYDKEDFEKEGFRVHDLEFADCSCPSPELIEQFLNVVDKEDGRVAVHCKAGLGRTGTMIGLWMMKHLGFTAREAVAWMRLCRPGCVIGQQQEFLAACETMEWDGNRVVLAPNPSVARRRSDTSPARAPMLQRLGGLTPRMEKEELGRQVEEVARRRALAKRSQHRSASLS